MQNIIFSTASELASAIKQKQVSALQVLEAHLAQIAKHNPALNAIITIDESAPANARKLPTEPSPGVKYGGRCMVCQ